MGNFMKKSSLALLMAVLVLLTAVLVGSMVTASAEEVTYEAAVFANEDAADPLFTGTLVQALANVGKDGKSVIKLYNDVELTTTITLRGFAKLDGQNKTIYIDESLLVAGNNSFIKGEDVTVANTNFVGQDKSWDGSVDTMRAFGQNTSGATRLCGAILVSQTGKFVMENCTMQYFKTNGRGSCIAFNSLHGLPNDLYYENMGIWLKDTTITNNYSVGDSAGVNANAVYMMQSQTLTHFGPKVHVSGNTVIENNYDKNGAATANVYVAQYSNNTSSVLVVEEDFTGRVGLTTTSIGPTVDQPRGCVFFKGASYDAEGNYNRAGEIFASSTHWATAKNEALVKFNETSAYEGNWGYVTATKPVVTNTVVLTVMDAKGTTEIMKLTQNLADGAALPTWADFGATKHTAGTLAYTGRVASTTEALLSTDGGNTWTIGTVKQAWTTASYTDVEVCGDYVLTEQINAGYTCKATFDFNGFTVTRSANTYYFKSHGTSGGIGMSWTIKNANFDGKIGGEITTNGNQMFNIAYSHTKVTFDHCTFTDFVTTSGTNSNGYSRAAAISVGYRSAVVLKDVVMNNCQGYEGAVTMYGAVDNAAEANLNMGAVYVEGNTQIANTESTTKQRINAYAPGAVVAVSGTFTGNVEVNTYGVANNQPTFGKASSTNWAGTDVVKKCAVPEGAKILGKIFIGKTFAYNNNGTLCWINPNAALDATNVTAVTYDADANKLSGKVWHYNDGTKYVPTTNAVAGYYDYLIKDVEAEAVINVAPLVYGDLATVIGKATAGQTVEVLKDVNGIRNISISKAIILDGNGHTLTWYIAEDPAAEADSAAFMFKATTSGIVYKDILFHGGAAEKGVWAGALAQNNATMLPHAAAVTFNNCTVTGVRVEWNETKDNGYLFGSQSSQLTLIDVTITDNIVKIGTGAYNSGPHIFRQNVANALNLSGKMVIDENYRIAADGKAYQGNLQVNNPARVVVGQLTEGSEVHTFWAGSYTPELNGAGKPYNNSGYLYVDNASTKAQMVNNDDGSIAISGGSSYQSNLVYTGTQINQVADSDVKFGDTVDTQGGITTDKFVLMYMPIVTADYYNTDVVVKINGNEESRTNLSEFAVDASKITVEVAVGMAELTDQIVIELQDKDTQQVLATWDTTAKEYAVKLIALETLDTETKAAVASLLQYGAYVQTFFNYNTANLAMTETDKADWLAAGYIVDVDNNDINTAGATVQATSSGSANGVAIQGASLTMENQMSLRVFFTATDINALTLTVNGAPVEAVAYGNMYYIEAKNIGTASLATAAVFKISDGTNTLTYTASPMTYVLAVTNAELSKTVTVQLKDACEALYYYYAAVAAAFNSVEDNTGFNASGLVAAQDLAGYAYSAPAIINL